MVGPFQNHVALGKNPLHVSVDFIVTCNHVPLGVAAHVTGRKPVFLRVDENGVILGGAEIQHRLQNFILHFDELHGLPGGLFRFRGDNGHHVAGKPHVPVNDQPIIGRGLREGLARNGKPGLGHILPGVNIHHPGDLFGILRANVLHNGIGVGGPEDFDHQGILGRHVVGIHGLSQKQLHGVLFPDGFIDGFINFLFHSCLLIPAGPRDSSECPGAAPRSRSSGKGSPPGRRGSRRPWGPGFPAAGQRYS